MATPKKHVAQSLMGILDNKVVQIILDRSRDIFPTIIEVESYWEYNLFDRKPGPAYIIGDNGDTVFQGTDLDLATFLMELTKRNSVINLPEYKQKRPASIKKGQVKVSDKNRHGEITSLTSNKDVFTFGVRINDTNIIGSVGDGKNYIGDYRTFLMTDFDGSLYKGWKNIEFLPSEKQNKFIYDTKILSDNTIYFKNFVSPSKWISFYGKYYFITKLLITRLKEESKYYDSLIKDMLDNGIKYPLREPSIRSQIPSAKRESGQSIKVQAMEVELDVPENDSRYRKYDLVNYTSDLLVRLSNKKRDINYKIIPRLQFTTRSIELAVYNFGFNKFPSWLKNVSWEDYKIKRTMWKRLKLVQPVPFQRSISIRYRIYKKSELERKEAV